MYHAKDGLYFDRLEDGSVKVVVSVLNGIQFETILEPNTWASVVASVCVKGEDSNTFYAAELFHEIGRHEWPTKI